MHRLFYMMKRSRKLISANKGETIMSNTVITIARQYGSGGRTVGKMLAKRLDIPCYDREIISLASEESGIHPTLFQDEKKKHGSLRAFLTGGVKNASPKRRKNCMEAQGLTPYLPNISCSICHRTGGRATRGT